MKNSYVFHQLDPFAPPPQPSVRPSVRLTATGQPFPSRQVVVEFLSGPNVVVYDYMVACYPQDTIDCADVLGGEVVPIDSVGGALPRSYSRVLTNLTVRH